MAHEAQIPVLGVMQIGESAVDQRAHEIERQRRALVAAQQQLRIGAARLGGELGPIDDIAAIGRQRHAVARLGIRRARLGILAGHAAHAHHRPLHARQQHQAHLQQHLELLGDAIGFAVGKALGAVTALQQEAFAALHRSQSLAQILDLPGHHDGRQPRKLRHDPRQRGRVVVLRLLRGLARLPARRMPGIGVGRTHDTMLPCTLGTHVLPGSRAAGEHDAHGVGPGCRQDRRADFRPAGRVGRLPGAAGRWMQAGTANAVARAHALAEHPAAATGCHRRSARSPRSCAPSRCRQWSRACPI